MWLIFPKPNVEYYHISMRHKNIWTEFWLWGRQNEQPQKACGGNDFDTLKDNISSPLSEAFPLPAMLWLERRVQINSASKLNYMYKRKISYVAPINYTDS